MISTQIESKIAFVSINRPEQKNALSISLLTQLKEELIKLDSDSEIRLIVIKGNENFSAGGDIKDMLVQSDDYAMHLAKKVQKIYLDIEAISKPLIAYTEGLVYGGGFELALCCDFIIANNNARFSLPEASLGIIPGGGATQRLKARIGKQNAAYLLLTAAEFPASKMLEMGVVQELVESEQEAQDIIKPMAIKSPEALKVLKALLNKNHDFNAESESFAKLLNSSGKEGIQMFINDKKLPKW
jgi:enoyl-CoA hydratase